MTKIGSPEGRLARLFAARLLRATAFIGALVLVICIVMGPLRADARPWRELPMRVDSAPRRGGVGQSPADRGGVFGSEGVKVVEGCRVIDWHGAFDGASLQAFKQCVVNLNNFERQRATKNIQAVRMIKLSVDRAVSSLKKDKAARKSVQRKLLRYRDELGKIETELEGTLNGKYPKRLLMMNSPGGYVHTLTGLLPYLQKNVDIYGGQMIASAGGVAFVSGKGKRIMPESGGQMGIHSVQAGATGGVTDVAHALREMKKTNRFLEKQYVKGSNGKLKPNQFREWLTESGQSPAGMKWLSGRQAMRYGLCDGLCRNPNKLMDSYRPQEIAPFLGEVKVFFQANDLNSFWPQSSHHGRDHRPPPAAGSPQ
jgi:ATP-dependent protease ClpP protease subunit